MPAALSAQPEIQFQFSEYFIPLYTLSPGEHRTKLLS